MQRYSLGEYKTCFSYTKTRSYETCMYILYYSPSGKIGYCKLDIVYEI